MNVMMWVIAGGVLGWVGFAIMGVNERRGVVISVILGVVGGFFGGNVLAPMLGASTGPAIGNMDLFRSDPD